MAVCVSVYSNSSNELTKPAISWNNDWQYAERHRVFSFPKL